MQHPGAIVVFVKTPGLSPIKTRLAQDIGTIASEKWYRHFVTKTELQLQLFSKEKPLWQIYWAVAESSGMKNPLWKNFSRISLAANTSFGERLGTTYNGLLAQHKQVILLGADSPQIPAGRLSEASRALAENPFVIGETDDGGFYLFGGRQQVPISHWLNVPWSQWNTKQKFEEELDSTPFQLSKDFDIDSLPDLQRYLAQEQNYEQSQVLQP